jgi:hypothetical protein
MSDIQSELSEELVRTSSNGVAESAQILLRRVLRILRGCGISMARLREMTSAALSEVEGVQDSHANRVTARQGLMCCDVVLKWRRDPRFLDQEGLPNRLSLNGQSPSFAELVEASAPGQDWRRLMESMIELGVVRNTEDAKTDLISDSVVACSGRDGSVVASECVLEHICGFLGSVEYNVFDKPSRAKGRFERACYASVPKEIVPVLEKMISSRGQDFVDVIDEWLARRAAKEGDEGNSVLVGAGAYVFVRTNVR